MTARQFQLVNFKTMMRLEGGGAVASSAACSAAAPPSSGQGAAIGAMSMSSASLSASVSSDFLGNQLATYFSQLFEKAPSDQSAQRFVRTIFIS